MYERISSMRGGDGVLTVTRRRVLMVVVVVQVVVVVVMAVVVDGFAAKSVRNDGN